MIETEIVKNAENFMRNNVPETRPTGAYLRHVLGVRKYCLILAEVYNADKFVVEIAALLHDVGADAGAQHAIESAGISREFLLKSDVPEETREKILRCIETHSMGAEVETIEQQIVQDADGIIFLEDTYRSFFETRKKKFPLEKVRKISIEKVRGMMDKIKTEEGIKLANKFLKSALEFLESV